MSRTSRRKDKGLNFMPHLLGERSSFELINLWTFGNGAAGAKKSKS
jgi:hypothetical protein